MALQSDITAVLLLFASITGGSCMENFKCKARSGCHLSGCDPAPIWLSSALDRNEFPITCQSTSEKNQNAKPSDQNTLANKRTLQKLTQKVESLEKENKRMTEEVQSLEKSRDQMQKENKKIAEEVESLEKSRDQMQIEIKRIAEENASTVKRLLHFEKILESKSFEATATAKAPCCDVPDNKNCYSKDSEYLLCFHCNFQTVGYPCGLANENRNDVNWIQNFGNLSKSFSEATIPSIENTDGYLFVGASSENVRTVDSEIITPNLFPGSYCIETKVFMSPETQYRFQLKAWWMNTNGYDYTNTLRTVYSYEFTSINWMIIRQNFVASPDTVKFMAIRFEAYTTKTPPRFQLGVIIDDISITQGSCPRLCERCAKVIATPAPPIDKVVPDSENCKSDDSDYLQCFHCDFQTVGYPCGMANENRNDVNWIQNFGTLSKSFSGATIPSIKNTDGYLIVGASLASQRTVDSNIKTPNLAPGSYCIETKLFMSPESQYRFQLKAWWMNTYGSDYTNTLRTVYSYEFASINWMVIRQNFASPDRTKVVAIRYEAYRTGAAPRSQPAIIIDDISITQGRC